MSSSSSSPSRTDLWQLIGAACALIAMVGFWAGPLNTLFGENATNGAFFAGKKATNGAFFAGKKATPGFNVRIVSDPTGAEVNIQGQARGVTPFLGNVPCTEDQEIHIELSSKGFRPWVRNPLCRVGKTLEIDARLQP